MEFGREPNRQGLVAAARLLLLDDMSLELVDLRARKVASKPLHYQAFETDAYVENISRLIPAWCCDRGSLIAAKFYQAFGGKLTERMAHDRTACPETLTDRIFRKFCAGLQCLLDDGPTKHSIDRTHTIDIGGFSCFALFCHGYVANER